MSILTGVIAQQIAAREGLTDTNKYLLLGWMLGSSPIGLGVTLALANQEADNLPAASPSAAGLSIVTSAALPPATETQAYAQTLQSSGGTGNTSWLASPGTQLPIGLKLDASGALSGTPATGDANTYMLSMQVTDSATPPATVSQVFTLVIKPAPGTTLTSAKQIGPATKTAPSVP